MTNEEAIQYNKNLREYMSITDEKSEYKFLQENYEALDMGIKALEQEPCEDCISRQAVKEMLNKEWNKYMPMELDINLSYVLEKISELPSVTPSIPDVENNFDIGYNCGYADAMFDISESEE